MKKMWLAAIVVLALVNGCGADSPFMNDLVQGMDSGLDVVTADDTEQPVDGVVHPVDGHVGSDPGTGGDTAAETDAGYDATVAADAVTPYDTTPADTARPDCELDGITCIFLQGDTILVDGPGAVVDGATVTVNAAGTYSISGTLNDGQILVDTTDSELVKLLLNGMSATSSTSSPLYVVTGNNVEIFLVADTVNTLTDAVTYVYPVAGVDEPNAALFSTADLDITGLGALTIAGRFNDGINCKDGLDIMGGTIVVSGADDGVRGKDNVSITGGSLTVTATNNGIKSDNETDTDRGYINVEAGTVRVTSGGDAFTAQTSLTINGGSVTTVSGGGSGTTVSDLESAKGLKGIGSVLITGGDINVDSADDGIHSNGPVTVSGGGVTVKSALDGLHAETMVRVQDGEIDITSGGGATKSVASTISAKGIKGTTAATINGGTITIDSADDGIHSGGTVTLGGGTVDITCKTDGVHAESILQGVAGDYTVKSGGGSGTVVSSTSTAKGLKSGSTLNVTGGTYDLNCADDGVHSDNAIVIDGGTFTISSADDGFHGEETLEINGGEITVAKSYEGLESKEITINDGVIHITSSDDGINVAGGDGSGGWNPGTTGVTYFLYINGGYVWMNAGGDGLDSNGNIIMTGGTVLVNGPTDNGNGPIDTGDGGSYYFKISGGFLVAAGSSGMAVGNSTTSTQYGVLINLSTSQTAGTLFHLETSTGTDRLSFKPAKKYQSVFFSSPDLGTGSHVVYLGGSDSGTLVDNLYSGGQYTPGTQNTTFSISSTATKVGSGGGPGF